MDSTVPSGDRDGPEDEVSAVNRLLLTVDPNLPSARPAIGHEQPAILRRLDLEYELVGGIGEHLAGQGLGRRKSGDLEKSNGVSPRVLCRLPVPLLRRGCGNAEVGAPLGRASNADRS